MIPGNGFREGNSRKIMAAQDQALRTRFSQRAINVTNM